MIVKPSSRINISANIETKIVDKLDAYANKVCSCRSAIIRLAIVEFLRDRNSKKTNK